MPKINNSIITDQPQKKQIIYVHVYICLWKSFPGILTSTPPLSPVPTCDSRVLPSSLLPSQAGRLPSTAGENQVTALLHYRLPVSQVLPGCRCPAFLLLTPGGSAAVPTLPILRCSPRLTPTPPSQDSLCPTPRLLPSSFPYFLQSFQS